MDQTASDMLEHIHREIRRQNATLEDLRDIQARGEKHQEVANLIAYLQTSRLSGDSILSPHEQIRLDREIKERLGLG